MKKFLVVIAGFVPALVGAQDIIVRNSNNGAGARAISRATSGPHVVINGSGKLELPKDTSFSRSVVVIGRPTYVSGTVHGDLLVVGGDLFLRPGSVIDGRATAIGGTVATSALGMVGGGVESIRDESYVATGSAPVVLEYRNLRQAPDQSMFELAGLQGFLMPAYDRVDGLSLPVGVAAHLAGDNLEITPRLTYRSRLGVVDPAADAVLWGERPLRLELHGGRETRSNERWNYPELINSAVSLYSGGDTRNYFRSDVGEARAVVRGGKTGVALEGWIGGRFESDRPITAAGNVYSLVGRHDPRRGARYNPPVERGHIGSGLVGASVFDTSGTLTARLSATVEQGLAVMAGMGKFTQLTLDGKLHFPTFGEQSLQFRTHGVFTRGDSVPRARYAYLGGSGTLPVLDLLVLGGDELFFLESRYHIPLPVKLPFVGAPFATVWHVVASAGVGSLPALEQEIGVGLGVSVFRVDYSREVSGSALTLNAPDERKRHKLSFGVSL